MSTIALVDRVKLNYAIGTIVSIVVYTFSISSFATYFSQLWPHVIFFIMSELAKLVVLQKMYALDPTYTQDGVRRQRGDNFSESIKFAILMILTVFSFAFICIVMGAPVLENYEQTFTLSAFLTGLTLFPISIFIGVSATVTLLMTETFELVNLVSQGYLNLLKRNAYLVVFGAFVGSAVLPLDWDRPWQIYPIPNVVGCLTAQMLGCFYVFLETMVKYKLGKKQQ